MSEQAPAGWYPDQDGNERYWDGDEWTEHVREPGTGDPSGGWGDTKREGAFSKLRKAAADMHAQKRSEREGRDRKQAEDAQAAGALVTSGVFGTSAVEIFEGGYVRVAEGKSDAQQPARITKSTPYERLRSIKFVQPGQANDAGMNSPLAGAVGPAVTSLMKGGKALMKGSAPGLAMAGIAHLATTEARTSVLTIATDKEIHTLTNRSHNGFISKVNKRQNEVGLALESAGSSVLKVHGAGQESVLEPQYVAYHQPVAPSQSAGDPTVSERLRELAALHKEGILSDEEFSAAKAKLLGEI